MNILVLCTGNSARSILLESILNRQGAGRVRAYSAGSTPSGAVHPQSLALLERLGYPTADLRSKSWDRFAAPDAPPMDIVLTVCDNAASEPCPYWPGAPVRGHWGIPDPAAAAPETQEAAFEAAYDTLARRAEALLALPIETMEPEDLGAALSRISTL